MCEANAYLLRNGQEERLMDAVDTVEFEGDEVRLLTIFGEQRILKARLKRYSATERKLLFVPAS